MRGNRVFIKVSDSVPAHSKRSLNSGLGKEKEASGKSPDYREICGTSKEWFVHVLVGRKQTLGLGTEQGRQVGLDVSGRAKSMVREGPSESVGPARWGWVTGGHTWFPEASAAVGFLIYMRICQWIKILCTVAVQRTAFQSSTVSNGI